MTGPLDSMDREPLLGGERLGDTLARLRDVVRPRQAIGGWATVELDRAERELVATHAGLGPHTTADAPDDTLLGARVRRVRFPRREELLLEPLTEGPLAAGLARHGEGRLALYLDVDAGALERARRAGFRLSAAGAGPLGSERRVLVGLRDGPFVLLVTP